MYLGLKYNFIILDDALKLTEAKMKYIKNDSCLTDFYLLLPVNHMYNFKCKATEHSIESTQIFVKILKQQFSISGYRR